MSGVDVHWQRCSPLGLSAGVHRNTNVYMEASNSDCITPSSAMRRSVQMAASAILNCCATPPWCATSP
jgi:hypothetical protein